MALIRPHITPDEFAILVKTVWGEARGEGFPGQQAVLNVIYNRLAKARFGKSIGEVCLKPYAFSCWLTSDPNFSKLQSMHFGGERSFRETAINVLHSMDLDHDPTFGATHYFNPAAISAIPSWAQGKSPCAIIGRHHFFRDIP